MQEYMDFSIIMFIRRYSPKRRKYRAMIITAKYEVLKAINVQPTNFRLMSTNTTASDALLPATSNNHDFKHYCNTNASIQGGEYSNYVLVFRLICVLAIQVVGCVHFV
jgi:hypothetical protein